MKAADATMKEAIKVLVFVFIDVFLSDTSQPGSGIAVPLAVRYFRQWQKRKLNQPLLGELAEYPSICKHPVNG